MGKLKFAVDEDFDHRVLRAIRRCWPNLDILSVQDAGRRSAPDPEVLDWAASEDRIILSNDRATLRDFAYARAEAGLSMPGVFLVRPQVSFTDILDSVELLAECGHAKEFEGNVRYLPL